MNYKIKVFTKNDNDKIELTEEELQTLLNEAYNAGYTDAKSPIWWHEYTPTITYADYTTAGTTVRKPAIVTINKGEE